MIGRLTALIMLVLLGVGQTAAAHISTAALCRSANVHLRNSCTMPSSGSLCRTSCKKSCEEGSEESPATTQRPGVSTSVKNVTQILIAGPVISLAAPSDLKDAAAHLRLPASPGRDVYLLNTVFLI